ncbi:unnamed protein product [Heterotrigona itama]|uniref:Uncharacterized protein n=1 Tax=Heterotrigona itama TaxID=395501 RepID=A0A6V7HC12_9HYME|nr:unnamed protein product [Heterotrigona itama]
MALASAERFEVSGNGKKEVAEKRISGHIETTGAKQPSKCIRAARYGATHLSRYSTRKFPFRAMFLANRCQERGFDEFYLAMALSWTLKQKLQRPHPRVSSLQSIKIQEFVTSSRMHAYAYPSTRCRVPPESLAKFPSVGRDKTARQNIPSRNGNG